MVSLTLIRHDNFTRNIIEEKQKKTEEEEDRDIVKSPDERKSSVRDV